MSEAITRVIRMNGRIESLSPPFNLKKRQDLSDVLLQIRDDGSAVIETRICCRGKDAKHKPTNSVVLTSRQATAIQTLLDIFHKKEKRATFALTQKDVTDAKARLKSH